MKNNNLIQMLIHDPFDFLNSKDLDTLPSVKSSHRLRRDKMMHSFTLWQNKRTTVFVKDWISLKMAFYPNISNPFFSYSRKTVFSWQCLSHRPTMAPCFEGPTATCVQKATQQWLCWKLYHMGEAAGQHAQLKFVIKCSVFSLSEESSVKSVYVIFNLKINPLIQRSHWHEWRLVEVCLLQRKKGEIQKKKDFTIFKERLDQDDIQQHKSESSHSVGWSWLWLWGNLYPYHYFITAFYVLWKHIIRSFVLHIFCLHVIW